jgi:tight adherence protein B
VVPVVIPLALSGLAVAFGIRAGRSRREVDRDLILGPPASALRGVGKVRSPREVGWDTWTWPWTAVAAGSCGLGGWMLGGVPTAVAGGLGAGAAFRAWRRRRAAPDHDAIDRRVQEFADVVAAAVRGGQSIAQAVEFAAAEARPPIEEAAGAFLASRGVGTALQPALARWAEGIGSDESRLLALVLGIHHRAGGNVAEALEEVSATIRHRLGLRRELRALTAQGRISGTVLGVLPVGFFLVMALMSRGQMQPVLHSLPGMAMVSIGLLLDGLAFLWIRRLLRIEA